MEVVVYALEFADGALYVGITKDLDRRLVEHRRRQSPSTRRHLGEFRVRYTRSFASYGEARRHEKFLKSGAGRRELKSITA